VEECPSPALTPEIREKMGQAAIKAAKFVNYEGVGTVEFLLDEDGSFYFMEMNTRIQVEHPVTEEIFLYDLIKEQIKVHAGIPISGRNYYPTDRYAMEVRINAEDPYNDFRPCPGEITEFHLPGGHGVRVDSHAYKGYVIPANYDSMIAKLIVSAFSREEVINKMSRALEEFVIEGVKTTIPFHRKLMKDDRFRSGNYSTKFLQDFKF
jgi:acetyl-CoA carboxylase biotin carboxylase subunit